MKSQSYAHAAKIFAGLFLLFAIVSVAAQTKSEVETRYPISIDSMPQVIRLFKGESNFVQAGPVTVTATAGNVGPVDYATLKAAFDAINAGTHQGVITISIVANTSESASAVLNASGSGPANYTSISLTPTGSRTISGDLAAPLIDLNGADNVTINGLNSAGNTLTISNTSVSSISGTSTIRFINGAQNNTITNSTILGSSTVVVTQAGGTVFFGTTTSVGNSNNTVSNNNIGPAGAILPFKAIEASGTTTSVSTINTGNLLTNNNVFDFFGNGTASTAGVALETGNRNWTISNNRLYQTAARTFTVAGLRYWGMRIGGTGGVSGDFHTITGNVIGFAAANSTGTTTISGSDNTFRGIEVTGASGGTATIFQNNTISGIDQTTAFNGGFSGAAGFVGIDLAAGVLCNISGNTIGSLDGSSAVAIHDPTATGSWLVLGIRGDTAGDTISGNNIGAISIDGFATNNITFRGITYQSAAGNALSITNNTIGGAVAGGAITNTMTGSFTNYEMDGIVANNSDPTVTGNTVQNISSNQGGSTYGILVVANNSIGSTVSQNVIRSLTGNNVYGMSPQLGVPVTGTNRVERNFIHSLKSNFSNRQIFGMYIPGNGTVLVANNMIRLGLDATGASITIPEDMEGIQDQNAGIREYYFNSIYIGGSVVGANNDTFAFGGFNSGTRTFKNNIFWNARSNTSGTSHNYAMRTATAAGLTTDHNDLYATGTNGVVGSYNGIDRPTLADWKTATSQDAHSISVDPLFMNPTGNAAAVDLHIFGMSPCVGAGIAIAGLNVDFDGDLRTFSNEIGADLVPPVTAAPVSVSGRVMTAEGRGISNASLTLRDSNGGLRATRSNSFGYYHFDDVQVGQTYMVGINAKSYIFTQPMRVVSLVDAISDLDFVALPQ